MPAGRPTKYDPAHCEVAEATLGEGFSETVLAGRLNVCIDTITEWKNRHPDFSAAIKSGRAKGAEVWERRLAVLASSGQGNATAIIFGLKNRVPNDWRDKTETEHSGAMTFSRVELIGVEPGE